jgi:hypothetical protein
MKYLIIALISLCSCKQQPAFYESKTTVVHDTVYERCNTDSLILQIIRLNDSLKTQRDTLVARTQRLKKANFKVTKAKYYLKILDANPGYVKYIKGWLNNRALAD